MMFESIEKVQKMAYKKEERDEKKVLTLKQAYRNHMNKIMYTCIRCTAYMRSAAWGLAERYPRGEKLKFPILLYELSMSQRCDQSDKQEERRRKFILTFLSFPLTGHRVQRFRF